MTNLQKELIQTAIPGYLVKKQIALTELAVKLNVGTQVLQDIKKGKWGLIDNKLWRRVWNEVNPEKMDGLFETTDCKSVISMCKWATDNRMMLGLTGDTGMGKTTSLKAFGLKPNVFYYYIDRTVTPRVFFEGLLRDMGVLWSLDRTLNDLQSRAVDELNTLTDPLLILDECGKLSDRMIFTLHSVRDLTINNCGIVLAGMPDFQNNLIKLVNRQKAGYSEFYRRINKWHSLVGLSNEEIKLVLEKNGIEGKDQQEFRRLNRFGDLMNEIMLYKSLNN